MVSSFVIMCSSFELKTSLLGDKGELLIDLDSGSDIVSAEQCD